MHVSQKKDVISYCMNIEHYSCQFLAKNLHAQSVENQYGLCPSIRVEILTF